MQLLVAEDNAEWRHIIACILEPDCDLAAFVERGDQILEAAQNCGAELITLDVAMPGESGLNVLPRLREMLPKAIIVIVSSTTTPIYKEEAFARGADAYIEKGKVSSDLLATIQAVRARGDQTRGHSNV